MYIPFLCRGFYSLIVLIKKVVEKKSYFEFMLKTSIHLSTKIIYFKRKAYFILLIVVPVKKTSYYFAILTPKWD